MRGVIKGLFGMDNARRVTKKQIQVKLEFKVMRKLLFVLFITLLGCDSPEDEKVFWEFDTVLTHVRVGSSTSLLIDSQDEFHILWRPFSHYEEDFSLMYSFAQVGQIERSGHSLSSLRCIQSLSGMLQDSLNPRQVTVFYAE